MFKPPCLGQRLALLRDGKVECRMCKIREKVVGKERPFAEET